MVILEVEARGQGRWAHSFVACRSQLTIDDASFPSFDFTQGVQNRLVQIKSSLAWVVCLGMVSSCVCGLSLLVAKTPRYALP